MVPELAEAVPEILVAFSKMYTSEVDGSVVPLMVIPELLDTDLTVTAAEAALSALPAAVAFAVTVEPGAIASPEILQVPFARVVVLFIGVEPPFKYRFIVVPAGSADVPDTTVVVPQ